MTDDGDDGDDDDDGVQDLQVTVFDGFTSNLKCRSPSHVGRGIFLDFSKKAFLAFLIFLKCFFSAFYSTKTSKLAMFELGSSNSVYIPPRAM